MSTLDLTEYWHEEETETMFVSVTSRYYVETTCVSVVLCIAICLAAADLGGGAYLDEERAFVQPMMYDPHEVIEKTKLLPSTDEFPERCERYLRQFGHLDGPKRVSLAE